MDKYKDKTYTNLNDPNKQIPFIQVRAIKVISGALGATGINYDNTKEGKDRHATPSYQDRLDQKIAQTGQGFGDNRDYDQTAGLNNVLFTYTTTGNKCLKFFRQVGVKNQTEHYLSFDGCDWIPASKEEVAYFMTDAGRRGLLDPNSYAKTKAKDQARISTELGRPAASTGDGQILLQLSDGSTVTVDVSRGPQSIIYSHVTNPCVGIISIGNIRAAQEVGDDSTDAPPALSEFWTTF